MVTNLWPFLQHWAQCHSFTQRQEVSCIEYKSIIHIVLQRKDQRSRFSSQAVQILKRLLHPLFMARWDGRPECWASSRDCYACATWDYTHRSSCGKGQRAVCVWETARECGVFAIPPWNIVSSPTAAVICHPGTLSRCPVHIYVLAGSHCPTASNKHMTLCTHTSCFPSDPWLTITSLVSSAC